MNQLISSMEDSSLLWANKSPQATSASNLQQELAEGNMNIIELLCFCGYKTVKTPRGQARMSITKWLRLIQLLVLEIHLWSPWETLQIISSGFIPTMEINLCLFIEISSVVCTDLNILNMPT